MHLQIRRFYKSRLFSVKKECLHACIDTQYKIALQANFDCELIVIRVLLMLNDYDPT